MPFDPENETNSVPPESDLVAAEVVALDYGARQTVILAY